MKIEYKQGLILYTVEGKGVLSDLQTSVRRNAAPWGNDMYKLGSQLPPTDNVNALVASEALNIDPRWKIEYVVISGAEHCMCHKYSKPTQKSNWRLDSIARVPVSEIYNNG